MNTTCFKIFFGGTHLKINKVMLFLYLFVNGATFMQLLNFLKWNSSMVTNWMGYDHQLRLENINEEDMMIGGENIVFEIDKSEFGK